MSDSGGGGLKSSADAWCAHGLTGIASCSATLPPELISNYRVVRPLFLPNYADVVLLLETREARLRVYAEYTPRESESEEKIIRIIETRSIEHIQRTYEYGGSDDVFWIVSEYFPYGSLLSLSCLGSPQLNPKIVKRILQQLGDSISIIHSSGLCLGGLCPQMIGVRSRQPLKVVLDLSALLGMWRRKGTRPRARLDDAPEGMVAGTGKRDNSEVLAHTALRYAAPEECSGDTCPSSDYWAAGVIVTELLTGRPAFGETNATLSVVNLPCSQVIHLDGVIEPWRTLCRGMLTSDPKDRWGKTEIDGWLEGPAAMPVSSDTPPCEQAEGDSGADGRSFEPQPDSAGALNVRDDEREGATKAYNEAKPVNSAPIATPRLRRHIATVLVVSAIGAAGYYAFYVRNETPSPNDIILSKGYLAESLSTETGVILADTSNYSNNVIYYRAEYRNAAKDITLHLNLSRDGQSVQSCYKALDDKKDGVADCTFNFLTPGKYEASVFAGKKLLQAITLTVVEHHKKSSQQKTTKQLASKLADKKSVDSPAKTYSKNQDAVETSLHKKANEEATRLNSSDKNKRNAEKESNSSNMESHPDSKKINDKEAQKPQQMSNKTIGNEFDAKVPVADTWWNGTWLGSGKQDNNSKWTIRIEIDNNFNIYNITYPSLGCGGKLSKTFDTPTSVRFRENISYGRGACIDGGSVVLRASGSDEINFYWYYADGRSGASGKMTRAR